MEHSFYQNQEQKDIAFREKMNDYLRATGVGFFGILTVLAVILISSLLWFFHASVAVGIDALTVADGGHIDLYVLDTELNENLLFQKGMIPDTMYINDIECKLLSIEQYPEVVTSEMNAYEQYVSGFQVGDWYYTMHLEGSLPDGVMRNYVVVGWASPARLLFE